MALRWIDSFEGYGTTIGNSSVGLLNASSGLGKYTTNFGAPSNFTVRAGRVGGKSIRISNSISMVTPAFAANDTWICGFGLYFVGPLGTNIPVFWKLQDGANVQCVMQFGPGGEIEFWRGNVSIKLGTTTGARIKAGVWAYIEVKVKIHGSTGTVDIHVNGVNVLSLTGQNTDANATVQATKVALFGSPSSTDFMTFDDLYICDKSGSNNTTFLGPQKVTMIAPTGDNGTNQWSATGAGTTHADRVKENPHDSDTTYLSDTVSGDTEEFDYGNTGSEVTSIKGVQVNTVFETDSASAFSVKNHVNSGGTSLDDAGTAGVNGTYETAPFLVETDPNTGSLWIKTNLDAALFGVKTV